MKKKEEFMKQGEMISFFEGVETWFKRINDYGKEYGIEVEHYIISCGLKEIIDGTKIAKEFKRIFGCVFAYDPDTKEPIWASQAINYTSKTQYIYRIRKKDASSGSVFLCTAYVLGGAQEEIMKIDFAALSIRHEFVN